VVYDAAGSGYYGNYWDGYIVLQNNSNYTITVSGGTFTGESCCDFLQFYDGIGTSGTVMYTIFANSAVPNFTTAPGQIITVRFYADVSQLVKDHNSTSPIIIRLLIPQVYGVLAILRWQVLMLQQV